MTPTQSTESGFLWKQNHTPWTEPSLVWGGRSFPNSPALSSFPAETPIEEFAPTPAFPALQYLESVDQGGVAWRAGLRTGDFLIEVLADFIIYSSRHQSADTFTDIFSCFFFNTLFCFLFILFLTYFLFSYFFVGLSFSSIFVIWARSVNRKEKIKMETWYFLTSVLTGFFKLFNHLQGQKAVNLCVWARETFKALWLELFVFSPGERYQRGEGGSSAGRLSNPAGRKSPPDESRLSFQEIWNQPDQEKR